MHDMNMGSTSNRIAVQIRAARGVTADRLLVPQICTAILPVLCLYSLAYAALGLRSVWLTPYHGVGQMCGCVPAGLGSIQKSSPRASRCTRTCPSTRSSCSTCGDPSSSRQVMPLAFLLHLLCCSPCAFVQPNSDWQNACPHIQRWPHSRRRALQICLWQKRRLSLTLESALTLTLCSALQMPAAVLLQMFGSSPINFPLFPEPESAVFRGIDNLAWALLMM